MLRKLRARFFSLIVYSVPVINCILRVRSGERYSLKMVWNFIRKNAPTTTKSVTVLLLIYCMYAKYSRSAFASHLFLIFRAQVFFVNPRNLR
jgi:hypothetical protein